MSDTETLSAEDKAYFDTRGESVAAPAETAPEPEITDDAGDDLPGVEGEIDLAPEGEGTETDKPTGQSKVPLAALTKERNARKAEAARAAEAERKAAVLEDRWNQVLARQQAETTQQEAPAPIDPSKDPMGALNELLSDVQTRKQAEAERQRQEQEYQAANDAWGKTLNVAQGQFQSAAAADPEFTELYNALRQNLAQEFIDVHGVDPGNALAAVNEYEAGQIANAVARGIDVADLVRKLAKTRNIAVAKKEVAADDLGKIAAGVNGSTSLSNAGGGRVAATSAQSIADMSPDDFAAWLDKPGNDAKFRKLAGG